VTGAAALPSTQLLIFGFGPGAEFQGRLVGALERLESGGALRVLDALFVARDADTGELSAIGVHGDGAGGLVAPLLGFRLDESQRRQATKRALSAGARGVSGDTVRELGERLAPGAALAAVLVAHVWADALQDAVMRTGGEPLASDFVDAQTLAEHADHLLAAAPRCGAAGA
jgi:hypothetical protein